MSTASDNDKYIEGWEKKHGLPYHMKDTIDDALNEHMFWYHFETGQDSHEERVRKADKVVERTHGHDIANHLRKMRSKK